MENTSEKLKKPADWECTHDNGYYDGYNAGQEYACLGDSKAIEHYNISHLLNAKDKPYYDAGYKEGYDAGFAEANFEKQKS